VNQGRSEIFLEITSNMSLIRRSMRALVSILSLSIIPLLSLLTGCFISPVVDTVVDPKEYSDNLIDDALLSIHDRRSKYELPKNIIKNRLVERFQSGSSSIQFREYLVSIGSNCEDLPSDSSVYQCRYERHRHVTIYKRTGLFSRGEPENALFGDRVDITVTSETGKLGKVTVVFTRFAEKEIKGNR